jgi:outer membrane protein assembly factor BamB
MDGKTMMGRWLPGFTSLFIAAGAFVILLAWLRQAPPMTFVSRIPGMDGTQLDGGTNLAAAVDIKGRFRKGEGTPLKLPERPTRDEPQDHGSWPTFRGPNFDNISPESTPLADTWPPAGPPVLWSVDLGDGHAGPAVWKGRVFVMDYDETLRADCLRCLSLGDGREIWRRHYKIFAKRNHGISRTVPAVTDQYTVTIGPKCHVMCVDTETGDFRWGLDLVRDYGTEEPLWYTGQCPIIDGTTAVIAPGGKALIIGVDCATGKILWQTPNPHGWKMSHASLIPMTLNGRRMLIYSAIGGVAGIAADGDGVGQVLWETADWNSAVVAPSPVPVGDGKFFVTAGYGRGSMMLQVTETSGQFAAKALYRLPKNVFACEQQTPLFHQDHLFSILPKDGGVLKNQLACLHVDGSPAWSSGNTHQFGLGPFLIADGKIFILNDDGTLTLCRASTDKYEQLAQVKVMDGRDAWGPMAITSGKLLLRDSKKMLCMDVRAKPEPR